MKVKLINPTISKIGWLDPGLILEVEEIEKFYEIKQGFFKGSKISKLACEVIEEDKTYTEKQWNDMKTQYIEELDSEKSKTKYAYEIVQNLTIQLCKKNDEIRKLNFYLESLTKGLKVAGEALREMRNNKNQKAN